VKYTITARQLTMVPAENNHNAIVITASFQDNPGNLY